MRARRTGGWGADVPVAVRSSATAEDLPFASFAGQQDTYLNVVGADAVLDAVRRCWASLWTDRAVAYRAAHGHRPRRRCALAVVVQRMVDAAGGRRAVHREPGDRPAHARRSSTPARAWARRWSPGRSTRTTSSSTPPPARIVERRLGDKRLAIRPLPGGGTERVERRRRGPSACLTDAQVAALAASGAGSRAHFGAPQDIEWAHRRRGTLWLTQSRPITTLYPLPDGAPTGERAAGLLLLQPGPGAEPADHADGAGGVPAARLVRRPRLLGVPGPHDADPPAPPACRRGRPAALRRPHRRAPQPGRAGRRAAGARRHGGPLRGGAAAAVRRSRASSRMVPRARCCGRVGRVAAVLVRFRVPLRRRRRSSGPRRAAPRPRRRARPHWRRRPARSAGSASTAPSGSIRASSCSSTAAADDLPAARPPGLRAARAAAVATLLAGDAGRRASCRPCCAGCRTTSPPRWTWSSGSSPQRSAPTPSRGRGAAATSPRAELAARYRAGALPAVAADRARGVPAPLRPPGRRRDRPRHAALVRRPDARPRRPGQLPAPGRPALAPDAAVRRGAARGGGDGRHAWRAGPARGRLRGAAGRVRARPRPAAGRAARDAEVPSSSRRSAARARRARRRRRANWPRRPPRRGRRHLLPGLRRGPRGLGGDGPARLVARPPRARTTGSCAAGTCRGCCSRTAPNPRRVGDRVDGRGRPARWPARRLGGHRHRRRPGWSSIRSARSWSPARSWWRRRRTPAGRRCS